MRSAIRIQPRNVYLAAYSDVSSWGGALASAHALETLRRTGHGTLVLGVCAGPVERAEPSPDADALNLSARVPARLWRFKHWLIPSALAGALKRLPPPEMAFVAISPFWAVAAKRAWPDVPVHFLYPCLLTNCLPFTWPLRRATGLWSRLDFRAIRRAERQAFERADISFVPNTESFDEISEFVPHAAERLMPINYGVRQPDLAPTAGIRVREAIGLADDDFLVAASGTCDRNKAFDLAIRALANTPQNVHLAIVGDGPERENLARLARDLRLAPRVHLPGVQPSVMPWYAAANCVISTSFYDTFPNAVLEGMAAARPVLVPKHHPPDVYSGLAGLVKRTGAGWCYPRAAGPLADELNALACDPQTAAAMGRRGRDFVAEHCTWDECAAAVIDPAAARAAAAKSRPSSHFGRGQGRHSSEPAPNQAASAKSPLR
jgi:glycosyltransferase involved in cell wall biosynthesis